MGDEGAGYDGLAGAGRGDEYGEVVTAYGIVRGLLLGFQLRVELEGVRLTVAALVDDLQAAAGLGDQGAKPVKQASG